MQAVLHKNRKVIDLHVSTVSVVKTETLDLFRCVICGEPILQIEGEVTKILPILEPSKRMLTISKCFSCGALYTFQEVLNRKKVTRVTLWSNPILPSQLFRCFICREPLLKYNSDKIVDLKSLSQVDLPYNLKCSTPECSANYNFVDAV